MGKITADRFAQGMTYEQFKASMTRNQERFAANEARVKLTADDVAAFKRRPLKVVAIAADWCGDVIANLPVLGRIAHESGSQDLRVFERDANADLMDQYLNQGQFRSIPVFVFLDPTSWQEVGVFIERPDTVTERRARRRREVYASDPAFGSPDAPVDQLPEDVRTRLQGELAKMREDTTDWANGEVIREIRAIVEGRTTWGGAGQKQAAKGA